MVLHKSLSLTFCFMISLCFGLSIKGFAQDCSNPDKDMDGHLAIECGGDDCDDNDDGRHPGLPEACDDENKDEDCDSHTFGGRDGDVDGFIDSRCCNTDEDSGEERCGDDCDDASKFIHPLQNDICNGIDDDCDGIADDDGAYRTLLYPDDDKDGYGVPASSPTGFVVGCAVQMGSLREDPNDIVGGFGYSFNSADCDDSNPAIKPGAMVCDDENPDNVLVCNNQGEYEVSQCGVDFKCVPQPNGTGFCQVKKAK